ncbi:protein tyrosine phosphatase [Filimonas lacunae]|nr:protein tyrosine phosphatase [Filimonas lacunae]
MSLLESTEIHELELQEENAECMIKDRSIPPDATGFVKNLLQKVNNGESIVIHCRMGIGRASIIAANILLLNGYTADQALANISKARGLKAPDTEEQIAWLRKQERQSYYPTQKILDTMAPIK